MNNRLYRSVKDRRIGGVAAGTAEFFDVDPSIARVLWVLLAIVTGGAFVIAYLVMWAIVPEEPWDPSTTPGTAWEPGTGAGAGAAPAGGTAAAASASDAIRGADAAQEEVWSTASASSPPPSSASWTQPISGSGPSGRVILGAILVLIGAWALAREFIPWFNWGVLWPIGLVVIGVVILLTAVRRRS